MRGHRRNLYPDDDDDYDQDDLNWYEYSEDDRDSQSDPENVHGRSEYEESDADESFQSKYFT